MEHGETIAELAKCIELYARGDHDNGGRAVITLARAIHEARKAGPEKAKNPVAIVHKEVAVRCFDYWREQCQHQRAKLTVERVRCIIARLKDGYSEADIRSAIDGAAVAAYVNEDGHRYDDIMLICRNGSKLESFIARAGNAVSEVDARVDEVPLESEIRDVRRAMAKAKADDDQARYEDLGARLAALLKRRPS